MKDYWIFYAQDHNKLSSLVIENIKLGWQPLGAPTVDHKGRFYQAMVRK